MANSPQARPSESQPAESRSPGHTFFWVGGIAVVVAVILATVGFIAPFLFFPRELFTDPETVPEFGSIGRSAAATFSGVIAVFVAFTTGLVGIVLLVVGLVRHTKATPPTPWQPSASGPATGPRGRAGAGPYGPGAPPPPPPPPAPGTGASNGS